MPKDLFLFVTITKHSSVNHKILKITLGMIPKILFLHGPEIFLSLKITFRIDLKLSFVVEILFGHNPEKMLNLRIFKNCKLGLFPR